MLGGVDDARLTQRPSWWELPRCRDAEKKKRWWLKSLAESDKWICSKSLQRVTASCVLGADQSACVDGCDGTWPWVGMPWGCPSVAQFLQNTTPRQALDCLSRRVRYRELQQGPTISVPTSLHCNMPCPDMPLCRAVSIHSNPAACPPESPRSSWMTSIPGQS